MVLLLLLLLSLPPITGYKDLSPRATYLLCSPWQQRLINESLEFVRALALLGKDASTDEIDAQTIYSRSRFEFHFREDTATVRRRVHQHFRDIYFEADATLRPSSLQPPRYVTIYCVDVEGRCRGTHSVKAYVTSNGNNIVLVCLSFPTFE